MYIVLTIKAWEESPHVVAVCEQLDISSFGKSLEEAIAAAREAIVLYVNTLEELGERERVFKERGIIVRRGNPEKKKFELDSTGLDIVSKPVAIKV